MFLYFLFLESNEKYSPCKQNKVKTIVFVWRAKVVLNKQIISQNLIGVSQLLT